MFEIKHEIDDHNLRGYKMLYSTIKFAVLVQSDCKIEWLPMQLVKTHTIDIYTSNSDTFDDILKEMKLVATFGLDKFLLEYIKESVYCGTNDNGKIITGKILAYAEIPVILQEWSG